MLRKGSSYFFRYSQASQKQPGKKNQGNINHIDNLKGELTKLLLLLKPERRLFFVGALIGGLSGGISMFMPQAFKEIAKLGDQNIKKIDPSMTKDQIIEVEVENQKIIKSYQDFALKWSLFCLSAGILGYFRRYASQILTNRIGVRLRNTLYQRLLSQPATYFQKQNILVSNLVHRLANDVTLVSNGLTIELLFGLRGLFFVVGGSTYLLIYAQPLIIPAIIMMVLLGFSTKQIGKYQRIYKALETDSLGYTSQLAQERLQAIKLIKVADTQEKEKYKYRAAVSRFYENSKHFAYFQALNFSLLEGLGLFSLIGILSYGSFLATMDAANSGIVTSSVYALYVAMGFRSIINTYTELIKTAGIYQGLQSLHEDIHNDKIYNQPDLLTLYQEYIKEDDQLQQMLANPPLKPDEDDLVATYDQENVSPPTILFKNISFQHDHKPILKNLDMEIKSGEIIALKGSSGSGKTTVLNLITKLIDPIEGEIFIDGEPLSSKDYAWIQRYVSYVPQDALIFSSTVYENIVYGNQGFDQSLERVVWAAKMAHADEFIVQMSNGYFTQLKSDGGVSLSGGQKQRIVLARAILKDPRILILDEATSNLDPEGEQLIVEVLKTICKKRTCLIVTHKIESFKELITGSIDLKNHQSKHKQHK